MPHADPAARRIYMRAYYAKHGRKPQARDRDRVNASRRRWRQRPEVKMKARAAAAAFRASRPHYFAEFEGRRRARIRGTQVERIDYALVLERAAGQCGICREPLALPIEIDHVVPLARGGTHTYDNLQAAHAGCNRRKCAKVGRR